MCTSAPMRSSDNVIVVNIYRPPKRNIDELNIFMNSLSNILGTASNSTIKQTCYFLTSDTNIDLLIESYKLDVLLLECPNTLS